MHFTSFLKSNLRTNSASVSAALALAMVCSSSAHAYMCSNTALSPNDGCSNGTTTLDTVANVNADAPFGSANWILLDDSDSGGGNPNVTLTATDNVLNGAWTITFSGPNPWNTYSDLMITMQGAPTNYVSYSLDSVSMPLNGSFAIANVGLPALGHARLWASPVPVPAAVWLLGSGLLGLVGVARRRK